MKIAEFFNDRNLVLLSATLLALSIWLKKRSPMAGIIRGESLRTTVLRIACGLLLTGASVDKVGDPLGFFHHIQECFYFIPKDLQPLTAVAIPWVEFFTGLLIVVRFRARPALFIFCVLMAAYTLAVTWDVAHGIDCNCSCFDKDSTEKMTWLTVLRDVLFTWMGSLALFTPPPPAPSRTV